MWQSSCDRVETNNVLKIINKNQHNYLQLVIVDTTAAYVLYIVGQ